MAKSRARIIRDPSGPATVSRETIRAAAEKVWEDKRSNSTRGTGGSRLGDGRYARRVGGQFTTRGDGGPSSVGGQTHAAGDDRFANAPALKPNRS